MTPRLPVLLCLDFDGTAVPIAPRPQDVFLSAGKKALLSRLNRYVKLAMVSGRGLADLKKRVGVRGLIYAGNHGMEIQGPGVRFEVKGKRRFIREIASASRRLRSALKGLTGVEVENKGLTLSVHVRRARPNVRQTALRTVKRVLADPVKKGKIRITSGKQVLEVRPNVDWNKGRAVRWLMNRPELKACVPIYIGDDHTDEDALREISADGIGVAVGSLKSPHAHYRLSSPWEVEKFLRWLADSVGDGSFPQTKLRVRKIPKEKGAG